jgi:hypothetical protein
VSTGLVIRGWVQHQPEDLLSTRRGRGSTATSIAVGVHHQSEDLGPDGGERGLLAGNTTKRQAVQWHQWCWCSRVGVHHQPEDLRSIGGGNTAVQQVAQHSTAQHSTAQHSTAHHQEGVKTKLLSSKCFARPKRCIAVLNPGPHHHTIPWTSQPWPSKTDKTSKPHNPRNQTTPSPCLAPLPQPCRHASTPCSPLAPLSNQTLALTLAHAKP